MEKGLTLRAKQGAILEAIKSKMSSGRSLDEAVREVLREKRFDHLSVRSCAQSLAKDVDKLQRWVGEKIE